MARRNPQGDDCPAPVTFIGGFAVGVIVLGFILFLNHLSDFAHEAKYDIEELEQRAQMAQSNIADLHLRLRLIENPKETKK